MSHCDCASANAAFRCLTINHYTEQNTTSDPGHQ